MIFAPAKSDEDQAPESFSAIARSVMIFATQRAANPPPFTGFSAIARSVMIFAIIDMLDVNMDDKFQCYSS